MSKKDREQYCISLVAIAMMNDSKKDWWVSTHAEEPPDGMVMTMNQDNFSKFHINLREIEVVEHRDDSSSLFDTIKNKITENSYDSSTILACLILTPDIYDLNHLSTKLAEIKSSTEHVFAVFTGIRLDNSNISIDKLKTSFTMVQLLPIFKAVTFDYHPYVEDFMNRYNRGQESRIIENGQVYFATTNKL